MAPVGKTLVGTPKRQDSEKAQASGLTWGFCPWVENSGGGQGPCEGVWAWSQICCPTACVTWANALEYFHLPFCSLSGAQDCGGERCALCSLTAPGLAECPATGTPWTAAEWRVNKWMCGDGIRVLLSEGFQGLPPQLPSGIRQVTLLHGADHVGSNRHHSHETLGRRVSTCALLSCWHCSRSPQT